MILTGLIIYLVFDLKPRKKSYVFMTDGFSPAYVFFHKWEILLWWLNAYDIAIYVSNYSTFDSDVEKPCKGSQDNQSKMQFYKTMWPTCVSGCEPYWVLAGEAMITLQFVIKKWSIIEQEIDSDFLLSIVIYIFQSFSWELSFLLNPHFRCTGKVIANYWLICKYLRSKITDRETNWIVKQQIFKEIFS